MRSAVVGMGLAAAVALAGCGKGPAEQSAHVEAPAAPHGPVEAARQEQVPVARELAGSVQAKAVTHVSARIMAQVLAVRAEEGAHVEKGALLVALDDRELQAKARQAEAALTQAKTQLDLAAATHARFAKLLEGHAVSRQEYENVASRETMAREAAAQAASAVEEARTWLGFAAVNAPVSGRVAARRTEAGSMAVPGMPLVSIEQDGGWRLELPADLSLSGNIARGTPLVVSVDAAGYERTVPVAEVVPPADPASRTFLVKADLPADPRLRAGQYARVRLTLGARPAVTVPASALVRRGQLDGLYVAEGSGGRLAFRIVQPGREVGGGRREVLTGLAAGEKVLADAAATASDAGAAAHPPGGGR